MFEKPQHWKPLQERKFVLQNYKKEHITYQDPQDPVPNLNKSEYIKARPKRKKKKTVLEYSYFQTL